MVRPRAYRANPYRYRSADALCDALLRGLVNEFVSIVSFVHSLYFFGLRACVCLRRSFAICKSGFLVFFVPGEIFILCRLVASHWLGSY